jgi:uncharacterized protein YuzE
MAYFEKEDILHLEISDEPERGSIELNPNITVELNDNGELIGINRFDSVFRLGYTLEQDKDDIF